MRLIDADALGVGRCSKDILPAAYCAGWNGLIELIEKAPTIDAVAVVRCRECKNHSDADGKHYCKFWRMYCPDDSDFFCKAGKRKEGADNEP